MLVVGFLELVEDIVQQAPYGLLGPLVVTLIEVYEINGRSERLVQILLVGLNLHS